MRVTAHEVGSNPDLYNRSVRIGKRVYDCYGYTRSGQTIKFACIDADPEWIFNLTIRYLKPDELV